MHRLGWQEDSRINNSRNILKSGPQPIIALYLYYRYSTTPRNEKKRGCVCGVVMLFSLHCRRSSLFLQKYLILYHQVYTCYFIIIILQLVSWLAGQPVSQLAPYHLFIIFFFFKSRHSIVLTFIAQKIYTGIQYKKLKQI